MTFQISHIVRNAFTKAVALCPLNVTRFTRRPRLCVNYVKFGGFDAQSKALFATSFGQFTVNFSRLAPHSCPSNQFRGFVAFCAIKAGSYKATKQHSGLFCKRDERPFRRIEEQKMSAAKIILIIVLLSLGFHLLLYGYMRRWIAAAKRRAEQAKD